MSGSQCIGELGERRFAEQIASEGLPLRIGPFRAHVTARIPAVIEALFVLYRDHPLLPGGGVWNFRASIQACRNVRSPLRRLARFRLDGHVPHEDMPLSQALAVLEWGMNLVIAMRAHCYLMLHSAALERNGRVLLLPAAPGFGKSTLCAGLAHSGWRLLSDEFGLIRPGTSRFLAAPRPIALKNESIDVIRTFAPDAIIGPSVHGTRKGTVAHVKPPRDSVLRQHETARTCRVVFPRWENGAPVQLVELEKSDAFMMLAMNAFNYELLGESAFHTVRSIIDNSACLRLVYSDLSDAIDCLNAISKDDSDI